MPISVLPSAFFLAWTSEVNGNEYVCKYSDSVTAFVGLYDVRYASCFLRETVASHTESECSTSNVSFSLDAVT